MKRQRMMLSLVCSKIFLDHIPLAHQVGEGLWNEFQAMITPIYPAVEVFKAGLYTAWALATLYIFTMVFWTKLVSLLILKSCLI